MKPKSKPKKIPKTRFKPSIAPVVSNALGMGNGSPYIFRKSMGTGKSIMLPTKQQRAVIYFRLVTEFYSDLMYMVNDLICNCCPVEQIPRILVSYDNIPTGMRDLLEERLKAGK
jgi:hypothetical protein